MTKLKNVFPLSFKFTKSPANLILGILLYSVVSAAVTYVVSSVISAIFTPFMLLGMIPIIGWFLILPIASTLYGIVSSAVSLFIVAYTYAGIAINIIAFVKSEDVAEEVVEETVEAE